MRLTNTKALFSSLMKAGRADCICDIGSCDGSQSLLFRELRPDAVVLAFEANPINFQAMQAREQLRSRGIEVFGFAISNRRGTTTFHIQDVDYSDPAQNLGTSSFFTRASSKIKESVAVETQRIDEFLLEHFPQSCRIGLWMDVEGAEYLALEGMEKIQDRVLAVHFETALTPMWAGQRTLDELVLFMEQMGFELRGSNITKERGWGDVVFLNRAVAKELGWRLRFCELKAWMSHRVKVDQLAAFLKRSCPWLHRLLRRAYVRYGT